MKNRRILRKQNKTIYLGRVLFAGSAVRCLAVRSGPVWFFCFLSVWSVWVVFAVVFGRVWLLLLAIWVPFGPIFAPEWHRVRQFGSFFWHF